MEVKGLIGRYHDVVLPISRKRVGEYLVIVDERRNRLSRAEQGFLDDYLREFHYDITGTTEGFHRIIASDEETADRVVGEVFSNREKFLFSHADSNLSFFVNGMLTVDTRRISGDAMGDSGATFVQFGGRARGTIYGRLGYHLQALNAQFWGSRELLRRDRMVGQAYTLNVLNVSNFDLAESYVRYDGGIVSAQLGRERLLWGTAYSDKLIASDNVRVYDFIRADAEYKALKYTFVHAWLLGRRGSVAFRLPSDTSTTYNEPVVADKYFAAHRVGLSFPGVLDIGAQEMVIYSNRSVDLAYLNPLTIIEFAQRSREERDNGLWAFDLQLHAIPNVELHGTFLLDDLNFPDLFTDVWTDRHAFQLGGMSVDPAGLVNTTLMVEYTKIKPYVFAHNRSRESQYTSLNSPLSHRIGPNADAWFFRLDVTPLRNLILSGRVTLERKGENTYDASGQLVRNVGADIFQPHRDVDPQYVTFLDGVLVRTRRIEVLVSYELTNQLWLEASYEREAVHNTVTGAREKNTTVQGRARMEF